MKLFEYLTREELIAEIKQIDLNLLSNIVSISNPTQGGITYGNKAEALMARSHLKARLNELDGIKPSNEIKRGGFWGAMRW